MDYYLFTARSITQAQRMAQVLEQAGMHAGVQRLPMGLSNQGCAYGVRVNVSQYERALALVQSMGMGPLKVFVHSQAGFREVTL